MCSIAGTHIGYIERQYKDNEHREVPGSQYCNSHDDVMPVPVTITEQHARRHKEC